MTRYRILLAALAPAMLATLPAAPAQAQRSERVLTIFGDEKCPTSNGEEIVVCQRLPASERYRIPKELRGDQGAAAASRWGERAKSLEYVGSNGIQSCSPVGAGGASGCYNQIVRNARAERKANGEDPTIPLKLP